jgi:hypothetical protein
MIRSTAPLALASCRRVMQRLRIAFIITPLVPTYAVLAVLKHVVPLRWLVRWVWCPSAGSRDREAERQLLARVLRVSRLTRWADRDCLQRSLLLYRVLSRGGADPTLVVGFHRMNGRVRGHAWVTVDGHAIVESEAELHAFSAALRFGLRGELLPDAHTL